MREVRRAGAFNRARMCNGDARSHDSPQPFGFNAPWFSLPRRSPAGRARIRRPPGGRFAAFLRRKGCLRHPQLSRRANSPTMFRTIGAARASGL
ncbi:hypothetical protein [Burkholderia sp. IDO3]|uniref:hypothetical protein n=1 Tax=Burkholderia sp. IDO3 TaxID=1705310 RepID=UPI00117773D2|nr:hypothetical protein [Burkholderia sp. IDO3]